MGLSYSTPDPIVYSNPVPGSEGNGRTMIYRNPKFMNGLIKDVAGISVMGDVWKRNFQEKAKQAWLGRRKRTGEVTDKGEPVLHPEFEYQTWEEVKVQVDNLGAGIKHLGIAPELCEYSHPKWGDYKMKFIGIYANNSTEYVVLDGACALYGFCTVPIYDTLGEEACEHMFNETNMSTVFSTCNHVKGLVSSIEKRVGKLHNIVIMDPENLDRTGAGKLLDEKKSASVLNWWTFAEVMQVGAKNPSAYANVNPDEIYTFSYTSGTTSAPKGAMISHRNMVAMLGTLEEFMIADEIVHLSYLPLAHIFERAVFNVTIWLQGTYSIFNGNVTKLAEDLAILKPTIFISVPRLYARFYDVIKQKTGKLNCIVKKLYDNAVASKLDKFRATGDMTHCLWDNTIFKGTKEVLGGRVQQCVTASAPIDGDMLEFLKVNFCCPITEAYGQTEGTGGEFATKPFDRFGGTVGGPTGVNEMILADVPEMKYTANDKDENGLPRPRGEICVRGANVIQGYYKQAEKTAEAIDNDGWLHSGDIGMLMPGTNALKIFDRKKNIFKLAQGEYVAPEKLENALKMCRTVADIFVYGDSFEASLVAIVNPEKAAIMHEAKTLGIEGDFEALCKNAEIKKIVAADIAQQEYASKFKGFEKIRAFEMDHNLFTENDLTTTSFKLKRSEAKDYYKDTIKKLYKK